MDPELFREEVRNRSGYSDTMVKSLKRQIDPVVATLKPDEEIGALLTSFGVSLCIRVTTIGHEEPHLIIIKGLDEHDEEVTFFQHVSQAVTLFESFPVTTRTLAALTTNSSGTIESTSLELVETRKKA